MNNRLLLLISLFVLCAIDASQGDQALQKQMIQAVMTGDAAGLLRLLNDGFAVDAPLDDFKRTALHIASYLRPELIELLIMRGAIVDSRDRDGKTPLMVAQNVYAMEMLLRNNADINAQDNKNETALMKFAYRGSIDGVAFLIERKADLALQDITGKTALDWAYLENPRPEVMREIRRLLSAAGAQRNVARKTTGTKR